MAYVHQDSPADAVDPKTLPPYDLPKGVTSRFVDTAPKALNFHVLESLPANPSSSTKLIVLCHGYPEIAYSWRNVLPRLAAQGYHAIAFDQRGYGRTTSPTKLEFTAFRPVNLIKDVVTLVNALGYDSVACIAGHDFGAVTASLCAIARPDFFKSLCLMSHPTKGPPKLPFSTSPSYGSPEKPAAPGEDIEKTLAELSRPRKHYKWYNCTEPSNNDWTYPPEGINEFLRGYFHLKSADWDGNSPHQLKGWTATELEKMPVYYIMDLGDNMRQAIARDMAKEDPKIVQQRADRWLNDKELAVYTTEWTRNTFQGGLNWYRLQTQPDVQADLNVWAGKKIAIPITFMAGDKDWGTYQEPGAVEAMENGLSVKKGCYRGTVLVPGAGHWVNQEQPERCVEEILKLAKEVENQD